MASSDQEEERDLPKKKPSEFIPMKMELGLAPLQISRDNSFKRFSKAASSRLQMKDAETNLTPKLNDEQSTMRWRRERGEEEDRSLEEPNEPISETEEDSDEFDDSVPWNERVWFGKKTVVAAILMISLALVGSLYFTGLLRFVKGPAFEYDWTVIREGSQATLKVTVKNVGSATVEGIQVYAALNTGEDYVLTPVESDPFDLDKGSEKTVELVLNLPSGEMLRFLVGILGPDGFLIDSRYSQWFSIGT